MIPPNHFYPNNSQFGYARARNRRPNSSPKHSNRWPSPQHAPAVHGLTPPSIGNDASFDKRKQDRRKVAMQELFANNQSRPFENGATMTSQDPTSAILLSVSCS